MTTWWYQPFMFAVALVWFFATGRDRPAARVILVATIASFLLVELVTRHITGAWKQVFPGAVETLTILALLRWARGRTGLVQAACLAVAWLAHLLCYLDVKLGTNMVYDHYRALIGLVSLAQILAFHDTLTFNLRRLAACAGSLGIAHSRAVPAASVSHSLLRDEDHTSIRP